MTVKEMIIKLQSYPQDMIVVDDCGIIEEDSFRIRENYYNGDSANPYCEKCQKFRKLFCEKCRF